MIVGKDVSHYQTPSDWNPDTIAFLIARASIGTKADEQYDAHIAKAKAHGLVTGAYHFNVGSGVTVKAQVDAFLAAAGDVDGYAVDVEGKDPFTTAQTAEFIDRVQQTGRLCGLYMSESGYKTNVAQDWRWVANWSHEPKIRYDVWQFGPMGGEDGNRFAGTADELRTLWTGQQEDPVEVSGVRGEDWRATKNTSLLVEPVWGSQAVQAVPLGGIVRTIVHVVNNGEQWAVTEVGNKPAFLRWRKADGTPGDFENTNDSAVDATLNSYIARIPQDCSAQIEAAIAADRAKATVGVVYPE